MNVAGAPVITFRRIGTRNSGRGTLHYFRRRCAHTLAKSFFFSPSFLGSSSGTRGERREEGARGELEQEEEGEGEDGRLAINPFHCETFESKSKFRFGGAAALSSGSAASASYLWTLSCPEKYLKTGRTRRSTLHGIGATQTVSSKNWSPAFRTRKNPVCYVSCFQQYPFVTLRERNTSLPSYSVTPPSLPPQN